MNTPHPLRSRIQRIIGALRQRRAIAAARRQICLLAMLTRWAGASAFHQRLMAVLGPVEIAASEGQAMIRRAIAYAVRSSAPPDGIRGKLTCAWGFP